MASLPSQDVDQARGVRAEFDAFANAYDAGMDNPLKRMVGDSADDFIELKVRWLLRDLGRERSTAKSLTLFDYGCGAGLFLRHLRRARFAGRLHGGDISGAMLEEARRTWTEGPPPHFHLLDTTGVPYPTASFDVVILCAVLHHIPPEERERTAQEAARILKPSGRVYIFEHNPYNPVTVWVVRHTPIDENAILLKPRESRGLLRQAGLQRIHTDHLMFFPPRWRRTRALERGLWWLPLGGQYVVAGSK